MDGCWVCKCCERPLSVHSYHHSTRQKTQQASFILFPNDIENSGGECDYFIEKISPLPKDHEVIAARLTVPANAKPGLVKERERAGISKSILFADSIDVIYQKAGKYAAGKAVNSGNHVDCL